MKNYYSLKTASTAETPSQFAEMCLKFESQCKDVEDILMQYDFTSRDEIVAAVKYMAQTLTNDAYIRSRDTWKKDNNAQCIYKRWNSALCTTNGINKFAVATAGNLWGSYFAKKHLKENTKEMLQRGKNDILTFDECCKRIMQIYNITEDDIKKIHFFVEQVKAGDKFVNSLRRMLYIYGGAKKTGKTTVATMLICILNGEHDYSQIYKYSTTLANELQIKAYAVPKISECNVALMDECFFKEMGKTYNDFKRYITSSNGTARLPYGQEFEWYGDPNYIATSNEPLSVFIKDWNDRRYLSVNFKQKPSANLSFDAIFQLWHNFVVTSPAPTDWYDFSNDISTIADEKGEMQVIANEFAAELKSKEFCNIIFDKIEAPTRTANDNRITLKFFIDYLAMKDPSCRKQRREIENAVVSVFGDKYDAFDAWLLCDLKEICNSIRNEKILPKKEFLEFNEKSPF